MLGCSPLVIPLEPFAECPDVNVEDGRLKPGAPVLPGHHSLLDGIGAAYGRAVVPVHPVCIPGTNALYPGDPPGMAAVRRPQEFSPVGARGAEHPLELHAGHHIGEDPVAVVGKESGVEGLVACAYDHRPDLDLQPPGSHPQVNRPGAADPCADTALPAAIRIDLEGRRIGLFVQPENGLLLAQAAVEWVGQLHRALGGALAAPRAPVGIHEPGLLPDNGGEGARCTLQAHKLGIRKDLNVQMSSAFHQLRRHDAHRAVVGGESLVQTRHDPADGSQLLDEIDLEARISQVKGRLDPSDPSSHNKNGAC